MDLVEVFYIYKPGELDNDHDGSQKRNAQHAH